MTASQQLVDFGRPDYQAALRLIPQNFHSFVRQHVESVAGKMHLQFGSDPHLIGSATEEAVTCAFTGLSELRWYLLYNRERTAAAEQAWLDGGVVDLCLYMRGLHQAERILLVSANGDAVPEDAPQRLSFLHEKAGFTLVVTARELAQGFHELVREFAGSAGLPPHIHLHVDDAFPEQYPQLLDKLAPLAVCLLTKDEISRRMAEIAFRKGVKTVSCQFGEWAR